METRNIKVSLETAKEWYKGDNNTLKELALQAFEENELQHVTCVRSWEEFCEYYALSNDEYYINNSANIEEALFYPRHFKTDRNVLATKEDCEAFLALMQLKRLRDQWWEVLDWKPDYTEYSYKHIIVVEKNEISIAYTIRYNRVLIFPTKEVAEDFLNCFRDLIEIAKELL